MVTTGLAFANLGQGGANLLPPFSLYGSETTTHELVFPFLGSLTGTNEEGRLRLHQHPSMQLTVSSSEVGLA